MKILQKAKIFSGLAILFFAVCVIIGFSAAGKYGIEQFMIFSYFFGIASTCFMFLWVQIFYRFMKMNETVLENNKECCTSLQELLTTTLNSSDYLFQKSLCLILAITHCYQSIGLIFTQYDIIMLIMAYIEFNQRYDYEEYSEDELKFEIYGSKDQFNVIIYMQLLSLAFGTYIQISIFIRLFFKVIDGKKEKVLLLNKNLSVEDKEIHRNNIVTHAIIFLFLWIALLKIRAGVYISFYEKEIDKLTAFSLFLFIQSIIFIVYCILLLIYIFKIRSSLKRREAIIEKNEELFQGWFTLVSSIMYSEFAKYFGVFLLLLMLAQIIFGFIVIKGDYIILTLTLSDFLEQNVLLVDTIAVAILFCYHFFQLLLYLIHPNQMKLNQSYQFSPQQTNIQHVPIQTNQLELELQQTPENLKK